VFAPGFAEIPDTTRQEYNMYHGLEWRWRRQVGRSLEDLPGERWTAFIHPKVVEGIMEKRCASLTNGEPFQYEARVRQLSRAIDR